MNINEAIKAVISRQNLNESEMIQIKYEEPKKKK